MTARVMLIDDEPATLRVLVHTVLQAGMEAHGFADASSALQALPTASWQVVVCDHQLPDGLGTDVCRQISILSPSTYRILLSGQVDTEQLEVSVRDAHIHRFVAKPWNHQILARYIQEGSHQSLLLNTVHRLKNTVKNELPALVADKNWIIRLANQRFCQLVGMDESHLFGRNLFAPGLSASPPSVEPEITRLIEDNRTWLGDFNLIDQQGKGLFTRMAITALNEEHRICCCLPATTSATSDVSATSLEASGQPTSTLQLANTLLSNGYAGHTLLLVQFPAEQFGDPSSNQSCTTRLRQAVPADIAVQSIDSHRFILYDTTCQEQVSWDSIESSIHTAFQTPIALYNQARQITPHSQTLKVSDDCTQLAALLADNPVAHDGLAVPSLAPRQATASRPVSASVTPTTNSDCLALPIFQNSNTLSAVIMPNEHLQSIHTCLHWYQVLLPGWQASFDTPMQVVMNVSHLATAEVTTLIRQLPTAFRQHLWLMIDSQHADQLAIYQSLKVRVVVQIPPGPNPDINYLSGLASRQPDDKPDGICLPPSLFSYLKNDLRQGCQKLQKLQQSGLLIWACHADSTEALAAAHQCGVDWLSGEALSAPLSASQLGWFA